MDPKRPRGPRRPRTPLQKKAISNAYSDPVPVSDTGVVYSADRSPDGSGSLSASVGASVTGGADESKIDYHIKIVVVGDGGTGKTCMLVTYATGHYPTTYVPTVFENYLTNVRSKSGKLIELAIWDTAGQEDYDRLRPLSYPDSNVILVCFSVDLPVSLENVSDKWVPEITHYCPGVPFLLVGLKTDLREDSKTIGHLARRNQHPLTYEEGRNVAKRIGAYKYMECSAKNRDGLGEIFNTAMSLVISKPKKHYVVMGRRSTSSTTNTTNQSINGNAANGNAKSTGDRYNTRYDNGSNGGNTTPDGAARSRKKKRACVIL